MRIGALSLWLGQEFDDRVDERVGRRFARDRRDFNAALGEPDEPIIRKVIGGYDFIAFSSDNDHSYYAEDCVRLVP